MLLQTISRNRFFRLSPRLAVMSEKYSPPRETNYRQLLSFAIASGLLCWVIEHPIQPIFAAGNENTLLVGEQAIGLEPYEIALAPPISLSGLSLEELLRRRVQAVWRQPLLIGINYRPSEAVFGRLRNRAAWREEGQASMGSVYLVNPYLLVAVEPENVSSPKGLKMPASLYWDPRRREARATYRLIESISKTDSDEPQSFTLRLIALNALDMNLNYAAIETGEGWGTVPSMAVKEPVAIEQYFRYGATCGLPGGCNELSPPQPELSGISLLQKPAELRIKLWQNEPEDISVRPDITFYVEIR